MGKQTIRRPFENWQVSDTLPWYIAYNETKHDRHKNFHIANFENLIDSVCGLVALLSSQFLTNDFSPVCLLASEGPNDGLENAIGDYFRVKFPDDWTDDEKYDFNWHSLTEKQIMKINYNSTKNSLAQTRTK